MARYVTKASGWVEDNCVHQDEALVPGLDVDSHEAADTGLITATGEPIYRLPNPIGFGRDADW